MTHDKSTFLKDITKSDLEPGILMRGRFALDALDEVDLPFDMPERLARSVPKRRAEYAAGRLLCHMAQEQLGLTPQPVGTDEARAPVWPNGISGSITHTKDFAAVWITERDDMTLGIDMEGVADGSALEAIEHTVLSAEERALIGDDAAGLTAAFSGKEALYKALFPRVRRFFGYRSVSLRSISATEMTFELSDAVGDDYPVGKRFLVRFGAMHPGVLAWIAI